MNSEISNEIITENSRKKRRTPMIVTAVVLVLVLAIAGVFLAKKNGMLLSEREKVLWALNNTLTENKEIEAFLSKAVSISQSGEYTLSIETEKEGDRSLMEYGHTQSGKQLHTETEAGGVFDSEITAFIDASQMKMIHSDVEDTVIVYHYTEENTGYLFTKVLPKETVETFNESLKSIYEAGQTSESSSKTDVTALAGVYKDMEFEEADERTFSINGADTLCQGYKTTPNKDASGMFAIEEGSEVTFYLDEKMLAAIVIKTPQTESEIEIQFLGGDFRLQNLAIYEDGKTLLELKLKSLETDSESTALDGQIRINLESLENTENAGILEKLLWSQFEDSTGNQWNDVELKLKKGVELVKMEGETLDIGNANLWDIGKKMLSLLLEYIEK